VDRYSEGAWSLVRYKGPVIWPTSNQGHIALPPGVEAAGTAILGGRLVRLAEAQEFWSTGGEAGPEEDCVTVYE
jgi:hypothetical protein